MVEGPLKKFALVVWDDAHSSLDEWSEDEIRKDHRPARIHTRGWLVIDDEIGVYMAMEWLPGRDSNKDTWRGLTFIPRSMIVEQTILKTVKPRKRKEKVVAAGTGSDSIG